MHIQGLNKTAWDHAVDEGNNPYTWVVSAEQIAMAKAGNWSLYLSDSIPVPREWFPELKGCRLLCLASAGGQQAPIFAALGAKVTSLDLSPKQLALDTFVAERENLSITTIEGDMADLSRFGDESFELIFNPPSTLFVPELAPIWSECYRVLTAGGLLMTGFMNPDEFIFDHDILDKEGTFVVKHPLPYVEAATLSPDALERRIANRQMFHFSHTMEAQLGGLTKAGFAITGFYEDRRPAEDGNSIRHFMPSYFVARARKLGIS